MRTWKILFLSSLVFSNAVVETTPSVSPFYQEVAKIKPQGRLGQVVKKEEIFTPIPGAKAWKIAYISSDLNDKPTLATALVVAPLSAGSDRKIVAWAHGTTGTAQNNGPSQQENPAVPLNLYFLIGGNSSTDYGLPALQAFIQAGYVVVGTDYQGLGGGGRHQYNVATTNGRDVINSIRAVSSEKLGGAGKTAVAIGWSQGGGAMLSMASDKDYIERKGAASDEIALKGFVALAPDDLAVEFGVNPTDEAASDQIMKALHDQFTKNLADFTHYVMALWGTQSAFPDQLKLTDVFKEKGALVLDEILSNKGVHAAADTIHFNFGENYRSLLRDKPVNTVAWVNALKKGSVAPLKPIAPVVIYYGTKDTVVPPTMGKLYQEEMCHKGALIERVQLPGEQSHFTTPGVAEPFFVQWIADRFADKPVKNPCVTIIE
ncbi:alpha/beta fold hydrolase [Criblamydia sequanensis]|uniref:Secretory lipase n=1 Tax=Candidatus Criblamydia sequanensis CRIB-18 TaxID=1437425 RepID=A0A090CYP9_9BACT|nr:alpha/beta fold hydrolase [Criblamydia sequanensis]CDR33757.1 Putative secretory lipase [Criblamydia sequanensis CRIB-18]